MNKSSTIQRRKKVAVFGIFDGIHEGHRSLFSQAKEHGSELVAIVGRDAASLRWKGKQPGLQEQERVRLVDKEPRVDFAVLGDQEQSTYAVLQELAPDVICLGYDQNALEQDLKAWMAEKGREIPLIRLKPFRPDIHHNSLGFTE